MINAMYQVFVMKSLIKFIAFGVLLFSGQMFSQEKEESASKIPQEAQEAAKSANVFAVEFYQRIAEKNNVCFSPFSISSAFAMVYSGAKGDTQKEIASVLHYPKSAEELDKGWFWLNKFLTFYPSNSSEDIRLRIANSLWIQTNFPVLPAFRDMMTKYFNGVFRFVDFKVKAEVARATINAWVKQNTFGKIVDILTPQALDSSTRMILVSALYMKAKWKNPFDVHETSQQPFFAEDNSTQTALAMSQSAYFPYLNVPEAEILEMPYVMSRKDGPQFSMLVILPHQRDGLPDMEKNLSAEKIEQWLKGLVNTHVLLTIPKFKALESINLNEILIHSGMNLPFSDNADFSGISGVKGLKIGNVSHKVYLSVDETGSEAAAATAIGMNTTAVLQKSPVIFQADHPFLYIIFEKTTGIILFMGRLAEPNKG